MAKTRIRNQMEKVLRDAGTPLMTHEIVARMSKRWTHAPTITSTGQLLARDKRFVKVSYTRTDTHKGITWRLKEELA